MRSGDVAVEPFAKRTCRVIASPTRGAAQSARCTNGFHSPYDAVSSMTSQTRSRGASISMRAWGFRGMGAMVPDPRHRPVTQAAGRPVGVTANLHTG